MTQNFNDYQNLVEKQVKGLETMNTLQKFVSANDQNHNKLMQGILFSILTHNQKGQPSIRD